MAWGLAPHQIRSLVGCSVGMELRRACCRWRVTSPALSVAEWVHSSTMATFPEAPLKSRTAGFPRSGLKPWPVRGEPSHRQERLKRWYAYIPVGRGLPTASFQSSNGVYCRFYQADHPAGDETAKCPEPLCPTLALPPLGRCAPSPRKALPFRPRSYGLMRPSRAALSSFGFSPRTKSLCRLLPAPAAPGMFPTLSPRIFPAMPDPLPRRSHTVRLPVASRVSSAFPAR
jgi:hypothetical protein